MVVAPTNAPMTSSAPNNGMLNIGIYSTMSLVYVLINYYTQKGSSDKTDANSSKTLAFIFIILIWLVQFFITYLSLQQQCNTPNYWLAAWSSFAIWFLLFVPLFWCLEYIPSWLEPFSNTFGYLFIRLNGVVSFMDGILKKDNNDKIQKYLDYIKEDPWALFSMLTASTDDPAVDASKKFDQMAQEGYLSDASSDAKSTFVNYVRAKESVAKFVFYVLTLNLMADMTFIVAQENSPCAINIDELNDAATPNVNVKPKPTDAIVFKTSE